MNFEKKYPQLSNVDPKVCMVLNAKMLSRMVEKIYRKYLQSFDITSAQLNILFVVGKHQAIQQSKIGKFLALERSTVSKDLQRLITKTYVIKTGSGHPTIEITDKGAQFLEHIIPAWYNAQEEMNELLGKREVIGLQKLVSKLKNRG